MKNLKEYINESILSGRSSAIQNNTDNIILEPLIAAVAEFDKKFPFYGNKWNSDIVKDFFTTLPKLEGTEELVKHIGGWEISRQDWDHWEDAIKKNFLTNEYNNYLGKVSESDLKNKEWFVIKCRNRFDSCKIPYPFLLYFDDKKMCKLVFDYLEVAKRVAAPKKPSDYDADYKKFVQQREGNRPNVWD